jgi:hypothetical protein
VICPQQALVAALLVDHGEEFGGHIATGRRYDSAIHF